MSNIKKLEELLKNHVLVELEETINELAESLKRKTNNETKDELKYMQDVKTYFNEALKAIENETMTDDLALDILDRLDEMELDNEEV